MGLALGDEVDVVPTAGESNSEFRGNNPAAVGRVARPAHIHSALVRVVFILVASRAASRSAHEAVQLFLWPWPPRWRF